jgi:pseudouridine-5'-monophosphatase
MADLIKPSFAPVRACLFDMDGLLLDSEDKYSLVTNTILAKYGKPEMPWSIKAKLQGRPGPAAGKIFHSWAQLPITHEEYMKQQVELQARFFPETKPLPGVEKLLGDLSTAKTVKGENVHIALATSSHAANFKLKTDHLEKLFTVFEKHRRVLGDDPRVAPGRGKPSPDIYLVALKTINESLPEGEKAILPEECLVFEDSVPGIESGRRAGMRCVWIPHPELYVEYKGRDKAVLAGRTGESEIDLHQLGEVDDGWADYLLNLEKFPYEKFGIVVQE